MSNSINNLGLKTTINQPEKTVSTRIKEETKARLEELGLDPADFSSETEAQQKIKEVEASQGSSTLVTSQNAQTDPMQQAFADAKDLAERLGIATGDKNNIGELLKNIGNHITNFELNNSDNPENKQIIEELKEEFSGISSVYNQAQQAQAKISGDLGLLASYNKLNSDVNIASVTKEQINTLQQRPEKSNNDHQQNAEDNDRNAAQGVNDRFNINNQNGEETTAVKKEEETSFLGQLKEKLSGGIFKKEDALKPLQGEEITDRQIFNNAKELASKIGMSIDSSVGINELLFNINNRISKLESEPSQNGLQQADNIFDIRREFNVIYNTYMDRQL